MSTGEKSVARIIGKLREAGVELFKGKKNIEVCKKLWVTEQTFYRWRKEYGGLKIDQAKRFKELEGENIRLRKLVSDLMLDKEILKEAASKNY